MGEFGGGGVQGVWTPFLAHDVVFVTLGLKLPPLPGPPVVLVDLRCLFRNTAVQVREWR